MLQVIFSVLLLLFLFRVIRLAVRAAWGLLKVLVFVVLFPGVMLVLAGAGLFILALPALVIGSAAAMLIPA
ncbi:MAG: hypothetical protein J6P48_04630 [Oscillospiraceae bacterium]|nr:hypothetical protein [Oscillospiraceae bacterium]